MSSPRRLILTHLLTMEKNLHSQVLETFDSAIHGGFRVLRKNNEKLLKC